MEKTRGVTVKTRLADSGAFEKWMWIELIGFDNERRDFGVAAFFTNAGFRPTVLSLLIGDPSFIHDHHGMDKVRSLHPAACSYGAHPFNAERERQQWTNLQVKSLVRELKRQGVTVLFNVFDYVSDFGDRDWWSRHPNVFYVQRTGKKLNSICPWKRLSDRLLYEDFFVGKLVKVLRDFDFDGYHLADAYAHPRIPVYDGDWSDDMVGQFLQATGAALPNGVAVLCCKNKRAIAIRADWIWTNKRKEWIQFHVQRIASFVAKVVTAVHAENKIAVANSAWTRDPFEAIYRYGTDYKKLAAAGIDAFVVEAASGAMEIDEDEHWGERTSRYLNNFMAALLLNRAYVPHKPMVYLNGIKDYYENWDVLRHSPPTLESDIHSLSNLYWLDGEGQLKRCANGPVVCLADGIGKDEWRWLNERWALAYDVKPERVIGGTVVWSDRALENQLDDFICTRRWTTHRLLHHLIGVGAPLHCVADITALDNVTGPIVVLNPHLYPRDELDRILSYKKGPIVLIGGKTTLPRRPILQFSDVHRPDQLFCYGFGKRIEVEGPIRAGVKETIPKDLGKVADPLYFPQELYSRTVSSAFLQQCATIISTYAGGAAIKRGAEFIRILTLDAGNSRWRLIIRNDKHVYVSPLIDVGRRISKVDLVGPFPHVPIEPNGSAFRVRVPGRGIVILDVHF